MHDSSLPDVEAFASAPGGGVRGVVEGRSVIAGRAGWLEENGVAVSEAHLLELRKAEARGATVVWLAVDGRVEGLLSLTDTVKEGSARAIRRLRELGLKPILLTGDNESV
ncbi:HAD family hydrolase, partial [Arthrobacter sp. Br18]|uniref:HAD family hydrolase n=1 Tax=Arthrobacter sp. Br18 TaxID=1312954 RepID=UPI000684771A